MGVNCCGMSEDGGFRRVFPGWQLAAAAWHRVPESKWGEQSICTGEGVVLAVGDQ